MIDKMLTKEEKKLFSKKTLNKIKRKDFFSYMSIQQSMLDSLVNSYDAKKFKNPIVEAHIEAQQKQVEILNEYYYDFILTSTKQEKGLTLSQEFGKDFADFERTIELLERTTELEIKKIEKGRL